MTWEAISAFGTLLSALVIAATALFAARQVRITSLQLDHLRRSTQLEGVLKILAELDAPLNRESQLFISQELADKMRDEEFRRTVPLAGRADLTVHKEIFLMRFFETLGALVKYGLIDAEIIYDLISPRILGIWAAIPEVVAIHRRTLSPSMWENYEWLVQQARTWVRMHTSGINLEDPSTRESVTGG
jgi:hypothetical protein